VMEVSHSSFELIKAMAETGNPNSVTDAGVGALCARTAVMGAHLNVKINASGLKDKTFLDDLLTKAQKLEKEAIEMEQEILKIVDGKIS
ncbi:MAG: cyclodeaminase/cyclohydrolase family protein, partial [Flavobacteriales bacterium]|nr:cyclodeaminase/cyclohydrolase family protein [Flavobacteriales bacterium]